EGCGLPDPEDSGGGLQVQVSPGQPADFGASEAGHRQDPPAGEQPIAGHGVEEAVDLFWLPPLKVGLLPFRELDPARRVANDLAVLDCRRERRTEEQVDVSDGCRAERSSVAPAS